MSSVALVTIVHGRHQHLHHQRRGVQRSTPRRADHHVVVAMDDPQLADWRPAGVPAPHVLSVPASSQGLPLAAARNAGAWAAISYGADLLVFLDVDCIPSPQLLDAYLQAAQRPDCRDRILCGPVSYLPPVGPEGPDLDRLATLAEPHPARPHPGPGVVDLDDDGHTLFWSLSFALRPEIWSAIGGFDEAYVGYGGEDTDFGQRAARCGVGLAWVGSATAYHQHHPVSRPPVEHAVDIVRNATVFHDRWGFWPMGGWLEQFCDLGLVRRVGDGFVHVGPD